MQVRPIASGPFRPSALMLGSALAIGALSCREDAGSPTGPEPAPPLAATAATVLSFRQVTTGNWHSCGVTPDSLAYCWGNNTYGQLGNGTTTSHLTPIAVSGGLRFREVEAGYYHTCGVTSNYRAYCWGLNADGELGDGTLSKRLKPVSVAGSHSFRQVRPGFNYTCALTTSNVAFCWGDSPYGALGDGTYTRRLTPVRVAGALQFRQISADFLHTCGVTTDDRAYCWGSNSVGELGDGTTTDHITPRAVAGGLHFAQINTGGGHTCARTPENVAYCWGHDAFGQLGDGGSTDDFRLKPVAVSGGLAITALSAAGSSTCARTTANRVYCWGENDFGQLGIGTNQGPETCFESPCSTKPVAVAGGLTFKGVWITQAHGCAVTLGSRAYCWGFNRYGQLGDGTTTDRSTPVPVAGQ